MQRYVRRNKTDRTDTRALLEANRDDDICPVPVKSVEQQAIASLQEDCTELDRTMAHRSDRRGAAPITRLAL